jgi:prefoldin subunit 5
MNKLENLVNEINEKLSNVYARIEELKQERSKKEQEKFNLKRKYDDHLIARSLGVATSITDKEAVKVRDEIEVLNKEITSISDIIETIETFARQKLAEYMPEIEAARNEAIQEHLDALNNTIPDLRRKRAEYLLFVAELNEHKRKAQEIQYEFENICNRLGVPNNTRLNIPVLNLFSTHDGADKALGVLQNEVLLAYQTGSLPLWVQYYRETGELVTEDEARELLKKLNK